MEPRRVHYEDDTSRHSHPQIETRSTYNQVTKTPATSSVTTVAQSGSEIPIRTPNVMPDGGGPMMGTTTHQEKSMDITTSGNDIYFGEYPDFVLPLPGQPRISDVFVGNSNLHSDTGSPMSILKISCLKKMYNTQDFAIDRNNGRSYTIIGTSVTPIDLYGMLPENSRNNRPIRMTTPGQLVLSTPQATSTPVTETNVGTSDNSIPRNSISIPTPARIPALNSRMSSLSSSSLSDGTMEGPEYNKYRAQLATTTSVSSLDENEGVMTEQEYSSAVKCLEKITKKTTILMRNWNAEGKTATSKEEKRDIDIYYRRYLDHYVARRRALEQLMTVYDEHYRESPMQETIPTPGFAVPVTTVSQSPVSHIPTEAEIMATHEALLESLTLSSSSSDGSLTHKKENIPTSQVFKTMPSNTEETRGIYPLSTQNVPGLEGRGTTTTASITQSRELENITLTTTAVSTMLSATHPTQTSETSMISGRTTTVPTTATRIIPITREESRHNALEAVRRLVGPNSATAFQSVTEPMQNEVRVMSPPVPRSTGTISPQVGTAVPISHDLIWPGHPEIRGTTLFPQEDDPMTRAAGGLNPDERWKVFHPYDIPGVRRPTMTTPENIRRMAESEALVEFIQTMEYLNEFPSMGERRDFRRFPPGYGDPHYHPNRLGRRSMDSNQERSDNQTDNTRSANRRDQRGSERRPAYGRGFMSPMR